MKRSTRFIAVSATAALALSGVAAAALPAQAATPKVAFVMGAVNDPFFNAMKVGAEAEAKAQGFELLWKGDAAYSAATQIPIVENVIATLGKGDALVLIPTDSSALQALNDQAADKGIVVANVDTQVSNLDKVLIQITGDNADGGGKAAAALAKQIGYKVGGKYQVAIGLTSATASTNVARLQGFKAAVKAYYPGIQIVATGYSESNPQKAATNIKTWLTKFPKLNGIFAIDGTNADGAAAALQSRGLVGKVGLVGYDAYPANVAKIKAGIFTALIAQDPAAEARLAIKAIAANLKNGTKPADKTVVIPNVTLTKSSSAATLAKYTYKTK
jgi:ABC-type sugar transport system substrate-binding protein